MNRKRLSELMLRGRSDETRQLRQVNEQLKNSNSKAPSYEISCTEHPEIFVISLKASHVSPHPDLAPSKVC